MRVLITLALLGVCIGVCHAACGIGDISLSGLYSQSSDLPGKDGQYTYNMNVCGNSNLADCQAGLCQKADKMYKFGTWDKATWSYLDATDKTKGVKAEFTDGDQCYLSGAWQPRPVKVEFPCSGADAAAFTVVEAPQCTFTFNYPTRKSCPGGGGGGSSSGGLSGGWVFIIILLVVVPVYVVGGCIYKTKKLGTSGKESCPNYDFWSTIPGLVKDGFRFTIGGCKRGTSYNQL